VAVADGVGGGVGGGVGNGVGGSGRMQVLRFVAKIRPRPSGHAHVLPPITELSKHK